MCLSSNNGVVPCSATNKNILGVISDQAAFIGGEDGDDKALVGLVGQLRVRVNTQNGQIATGDPITVSETTGVGTKALQSGFIVGRAVESYNPNGDGKVLVSISSGWYDPDVYLTNTGNFNVFDNGSGNFVLRNPQGQDITRAGAFSDVSSAKISAGSLDVQNFTVKGQNVTDLVTNNATATGQLGSRVATLEAQMTGVQNQIASQAATLNQLSQLTTQLASFTASSAAALGLDELTAHTATVSGTLNVLGRTTLNDLGITGTITTGVLTINGLDDDGQASINTLAGDLKLQSEGFGGVDILAGKITIDTDGDMKVMENFAAKTVTTTKLNIVDAIAATGSSTLAASAGVATIDAGDTSIDIDTTALTNKSLIFATPDDPISVGTKAKDSNTFTIKLNSAQTSDVKVKWWIVN
jgi:hypothetical protein